jgi:hypothetical protein
MTIITGVAGLASLIAMNGNADNQDGNQSASDALLKWLDLSQTQIAALLGISPQAISKTIKEEGIGFLAKDRRAQRLHSAMLFIGGDRYALSMVRLKELSSQLGFGAFDEATSNTVRASDLYANSDEIWVVGDNPGKVVDWDALKDILYSEKKNGTEPIVVFFVSTLEGAANWAEALERESIKPAIQDGHVQSGKGRQYGAYVFVVASNLTAFSGEYVIANPGSRCIGVTASAKATGLYYWNGSSYSSANPSCIKGFVQAVHRNELGQGSLKAHFFPSGDRLPKETIDFSPKFIDGLIGKLGTTMVGGVLRDQSQQPECTVEFNNRRKYNPAFFLAYKRKPGDSFNEWRSMRAVQDELDRQNRKDEESGSDAMANW